MRTNYDDLLKLVMEYVDERKQFPIDKKKIVPRLSEILSHIEDLAFDIEQGDYTDICSTAPTPNCNGANGCDTCEEVTNGE